MGDVGFVMSDVATGVRAEGAIDKIVGKVHPTALSEKRRRAVICYVQSLIKRYLGCEVFPYGSVPLKTYLPDGDIDLTAFVGVNLEEALANDVVSVLQAEEQNDAAEFIVKDVQLIRAEVKLVKCIVQNIVVDISFNQLGGLCTLCFLEKVNRLIGKDHLFKRSIILIKAWCYYESRILGAHHALISTYALETMVLYIFHLFHSELDGPLAVLYRFLDYFSKFDWDHYCISLNGPVQISSLPEIEDLKIDNGERDLLLSDEFLRDCENLFSVPSRGFGKNSQTFTPKHLNIIDPLKGNNNLGRSVSKGNLFRIRSAFAYGARKLGRALSQEEDIGEELSKFFSNTLDRHGNGQRPDVQDLGSINGVRKWDSGDDDNDDDDASFRTQQSGDYHDGEIKGKKHERGSSTFCSRDAEDLVSSKLPSLKVANDAPKAVKATPPFAPHLYFSGSKANANSSGKISSCGREEKVSSVSNKQVPKPVGTKDVAFHEHSLSDLNGDYESQFNSLRYGRFCYEHSSAVPGALPPPLPSQWDLVRHALPFKRNGFANGHANGVGMIPRPGFYPNNAVMLATPPGNTSFGREDFPKQRGTGTYIPNVNRPPYRNHLMGRGEMNEHGPLSRSHHSPRHTSWTPFRKIDSSYIVNSLDVMHQLRREEDNGLGGNDVPHVPEKSKNATGQQNLPSTLNLSPPPPPPCASEELQSPTPVSPASSNNSRPLMANSLYRLRDEDDFPPLSM